MAAETVNQLPDTEEVRKRLALEASWEIEALTDALVREMGIIDVENMALRGITLRIKDLSHVIMGALSDDMETPSDMSRVLRGTSYSATV